MDYIQSKVEEILYHYVGIEKPVKKDKLDALEVKTDLLPPLDDLEQVSPDSDKKSTMSDDILNEAKGEEVEEEIVDEDFESPAFEPIESILLEKNESSHHSDLSAISGLTSQDSMEDKPEPPAVEEEQQIREIPSSDLQQDSQLSQISSLQDMSQEEPESIPVSINEEAQLPSSSTAATEHQEEMASVSEKVKIDTEAVTAECPDEPMETTDQPEKSQFDLNKDAIEFTGTERKSQPLEDSMPSTDTEKVLQPQDVPSNTMEIDNLYENDTDSSEMRMEIDLKDETTQETAESSKIEESSQDSSVSKEKHKSEVKKDSHHHSHHKSDRSRDKHKSSSSSHKPSHHHRSSSSRSKHDDKHRSRSDGKSSSSSHKRSSSDKHRSSSSRREYDKKSSKDDSKRHHRDKADDHHQEKSSSTRKRRSTDHDSNEGKGSQQDKPASFDTKPETATKVESPPKSQEPAEKPVVAENQATENSEVAGDTKTSTPFAKKESKSSILVKYDYLKSKPPGNDIEDGCLGFDVTEELPSNPWFDCLRKDALKGGNKKKVNRRPSLSSYLEKKTDGSLSLSLTKTKAKTTKVKTLPSPVDEAGSADGAAKMSNGSEETKVQSVLQQQRYDTEELYKPRMDYGNRNRRRGRASEDVPAEEVKEPQAEKVAEWPSLHWSEMGQFGGYVISENIHCCVVFLIRS